MAAAVSSALESTGSGAGGELPTVTAGGLGAISGDLSPEGTAGVVVEGVIRLLLSMKEG